MSDSFGDTPWEIDAEYLTWCRRPRLYWITWPVHEESGVEFQGRCVHLSAQTELEEFITPGWKKVDTNRSFPTFTTSRPRQTPGHRPAGLHQCDEATLDRWRADQHR